MTIYNSESTQQTEQLQLSSYREAASMNLFREDLASRVAKAEEAANRVVGSCIVARLHAERVVTTDVSNVHVAGRNAAASAARDASVRCLAASSAALKVAVGCEAVAEASGAQRAREAAALCAADGAAAASHAANAFADSCVTACADAVALTAAAREAAARCVLARDDAVTAALVVRKTRMRFAVAIATQAAHCKASREASQGHKKARKDAAAAALAAREAAVRCAAASRGALSAAAAAREASSCCDAVGGDLAAAAAAKAREAADRCVADGADAADPVVPRADAAAVEAREAATSCDAALADPVADADIEFVDKMRGWLMTVATLFVGIVYQATVNPPAGMSFDSCLQSTDEEFGAPTPATTADNGLPPACLYHGLNMVTMVIGLTMLVVLLTMKKGKSGLTLFYIKFMVVALAFGVASSLVIGTYGKDQVFKAVLPSFFIYVTAVAGGYGVALLIEMYS